MDWDKKKEDELRSILDRFSGLIRVHIIKFNPQRFGLDPDDISQEIRIKIWRLIHHEKNIKNYASYIKKIVNSNVSSSPLITTKHKGNLNWGFVFKGDTMIVGSLVCGILMPSLDF